MSVNLTDEQRAGLARFLGYREVYGTPAAWLCDRDGTAANEVSWTDADLMLALLERLAATGHYVRLDSPMFKNWCVYVDQYDATELADTSAATPLEAVILAVLQLPEAQPEHRQE